MSKFSACILGNLCRTYDFYAEYPGSSVRDLSDELDVKINTARSWVWKLHDHGHLTRKPGLHKIKGQEPDAYFVVEGKRPASLPPRAPNVYKTEDGKRHQSSADCKRIMVKAQQVGMVPYRDLPREFFGRQAAA